VRRAPGRETEKPALGVNSRTEESIRKQKARCDYEGRYLPFNFAQGRLFRSG